MTKTFFIADIHLHFENTRRMHLFKAFLDQVIRARANLYVLGDLFEFWANNRFLIRRYLDILSIFKEAASGGLKTGLLIGNRDFLITDKTLAPFGIDFLGEEAEISLDGKRLFLAHGHTLCLSDTQFLNYKERMWPLFRALDRILPGWIENPIARRFILKSKEVISAQDPSRFQFTEAAIERLFRSGIDAVICGHTHKPETRRSGERVFYALPAWDEQAGHYLMHHEGLFSMHEFRSGSSPGSAGAEI